MSNQSKPLPAYGNLALEPTPAEAAAWEALTRDEQLAILREHVTNAEAMTGCGLSMPQIMDEIRKGVFAKEDA